MLESSMPLISRAVDPNQLREPLQPGGLLPHQFVRLSERSIAHCSCPAEAEAEALWRVRISGITRASERAGRVGPVVYLFLVGGGCRPGHCRSTAPAPVRVVGLSDRSAGRSPRSAAAAAAGG